MPERKVSAIDLTKPLDEANEKWLKSFLEAHPDQTFFAQGYYKFNGLTIYLSQSLVRRYKRIEGIKKPLIKYDVLEQLDQGGFGIVYASKRTLTLGKKSLRGVDDNNHIVKLTSETGLPKSDIGATSLSELHAERTLLDIGHRSRPKALQHQAYDEANISLLTIRRFTGQSLQALMDKKHPFTPEQRLKLSIALLRALQEQVHDLGMIHRDIKPGNIIVDIDTMEVNIIDFGLSIEKSHPDGHCCGTPLYASPEILLNPETIDEKSDIYCMGRVLAQLWGDNHQIWRDSTSQKQTFAITAHGQYNLNNLFQANKDAFASINQPIRNKIKFAITQMVEYDPKYRSPVNGLMPQFHRAYLGQCCPLSNTDDLSNSFKQGLAFRKILVSAKNATIFLSTLTSELNNIADDPSCIREFTHGLGWHALQSAKSRAEVNELAKKIINAYYMALKKYKCLLTSIETKREQYKAIYNTDVFSDFHELFHELNHKLCRIENRLFDFDWLQKSTQALDNKYAHWEARLNKVSHDLTTAKPLKNLLPVIQRLSIKKTADPLDQLKNKLRAAIQKYLSKTFTDENIINKDRAASKRRQHDIYDFNRIIESASDAKTLIKNTKTRMSGIETGWFFRSKLRSNLEKVIEQHEKNKSKRLTT